MLNIERNYCKFTIRIFPSLSDWPDCEVFFFFRFYSIRFNMNLIVNLLFCPNDAKSKIHRECPWRINNCVFTTQKINALEWSRSRIKWKTPNATFQYLFIIISVHKSAMIWQFSKRKKKKYFFFLSNRLWINFNESFLSCTLNDSLYVVRFDE